MDKDKKKAAKQKIYARDIGLIESRFNGSTAAELKKCPRCKSSRLGWRLDGARWCKYCGQRVDSKGVIMPSFDKREFYENYKGGEVEVDESEVKVEKSKVKIPKEIKEPKKKKEKITNKEKNKKKRRRKERRGKQSE